MKCFEYAKQIVDKANDGRPLPLNWRDKFKECEDFPKPEVVECTVNLKNMAPTYSLFDIKGLDKIFIRLVNKKWKIVATEIIE